MQEGWGEGEGSVSASRHSSWEDEEESGGVWNSTGSQGSSSSYNSSGWGQGHAAKKPNKVRAAPHQGQQTFLQMSCNSLGGRRRRGTRELADVKRL